MRLPSESIWRAGVCTDLLGPRSLSSQSEREDIGATIVKYSKQMSHVFKIFVLGNSQHHRQQMWTDMHPTSKPQWPLGKRTFTKFSCSTRSGRSRMSPAWLTDNVLARLNVVCNIINCIMQTEWVTFFVSFCIKEDVLMMPLSYWPNIRLTLHVQDAPSLARRSMLHSNCIKHHINPWTELYRSGLNAKWLPTRPDQGSSDSVGIHWPYIHPHVQID